MADRPKNWLVIKVREYHTWLGVALSLFIMVVCFTGIYLNHKDFFMGKVKPEKHASGAFTTAYTLDSLPVSFSKALTIAQDKWGETPIEHIQLKDEHGSLVYKVKGGDERELLIDPQTGSVTEKDMYKLTKYNADGSGVAGTNWGKLFDDLHTGKIAGTPGQLLVDFTSITIMVLTVTGVYLWLIPLLRRRQAQAASKKAKEALAAKQALNVVPSVPLEKTPERELVGATKDLSE